MTETNFTPGPWTAYPDLSSNCFFIAQQDGAQYTPDYSDVCGLKCHTWNGERFSVQQANAHLIAAAPELLESLTNLVGLAKLGAASLDKYHAALSEAESAIAKARGES